MDINPPPPPPKVICPVEKCPVFQSDGHPIVSPPPMPPIDCCPVIKKEVGSPPPAANVPEQLETEFLVPTKKYTALNGVAHHRECLPEDWLEVHHDSGFLIYLHRLTRVVTFSRPYVLGENSARHHSPPISAIPCLEHERYLKNRNAEANINVKVLTTDFVTPTEIVEYAKSRYEFKVEDVLINPKTIPKGSNVSRKRMRPSDHREKMEESKYADNLDSLPSAAQILSIHCPGTSFKKDKKIELNPVGKTTITVLHEFVQRSLRTQIHYTPEELEFVTDTFMYTIYVEKNENTDKVLMEDKVISEKLLKLQIKSTDPTTKLIIGRGRGKSKKEAKLNAGKAALEIMLPMLIFDERCVCESIEGNEVKDDETLTYFNNIKIESPYLERSLEKSGQDSPHAMLLNILKKHPSAGTVALKMKWEDEVKPYKFSFMFDEIVVSVFCKSRKEGRQLAAQKMIQTMHPEFTSWGDVLRKYGTKMQQINDPDVIEQKELIKIATDVSNEFKTKNSHNYEPNFKVLNALREHHLRCYDQFKPMMVKQDISDKKPPITNPKKAEWDSKMEELKSPSKLWKKSVM
uniref:DRBM domain-containing protein n=1 Tax=Rhabditophanes sp. KR3021 TaxID=114890 RepID=A0AC35TGB4_9BILA